ncbi:alpha/beta hydrolase [Clostridium sp. SYSU_GA19001]|uniref:alpha/beta hydrolase n=1 Tax=Clostridium caldaquaticum TaxID=2940653 RepID=UPI002077612D|nr:alpha/beta hydrolase [Clostridium caldaquaticum]MCM8712052.1 alpha/beta hydrolase [Clostridium caldaquaticum]
MRKYDLSAIEKLQNETSIIENNGVKIILKPSPGEDRPGYLDPAELSIIKEHWAGNPMEQKEGEEMPPMEVLIPIMRDNMGFPNYNLNTVEIHTKYEEITESGNTVGLWRYYPRKSEKNRKRPAFVFFHGGGWIGGSVYTVENFCKLLAELADAVVFNVDYSLAPEKPFPNGLNDNYYAVKHVYENAEAYGIDRDKICVGGDSAGGNYAAAVSLKARDEGTFKIAMQVLIYPAVTRADAKVPGYEWSEDFFEVSEEQKYIIKGLLGLGRPVKFEDDLFITTYISNKEDIYNPYVSPMFAASHAGLPKAILAGAEFDGLRINTEFYAKQLMESGVDVTVFRYKGMTHAFIDKLGHVPQAEDLCIEIAKAVKKL